MPHTLTPSPAPSAAASDAAWSAYARLRGLQRRLGAFCAALLVLALLALADGMQGLMRADAGVLELIPGESLSISGPAALKNPVKSDLQAAFDPPGPALALHLEGFFTGYWMGNGMWRAQVAAGPTAEPGRYSLRIRFRHAPPGTDQSLSVLVYADDRARRAAAFSLLQRLLGWSPFILAASLFLPVLVAGVLVFALGSRCQRLLAALGCGEVLRVQTDATDRRLWCLLLGASAPAPGTLCTVLNPQGRPLAQAAAQALPPNPRGVLELLERGTAAASDLSARSAVRPGCLVRLRPPGPRTPRATAR